MNPESEVYILLFLVRRLKLITGHTRVSAAVSLLDMVNEDSTCLLLPFTVHLQITNITDSRDHQRLWGGRVTWQHFAVWKDKAMSPDSNWEGIVSIWQMKIYTFLSWQNLSCRNNEWKFDSWFNIGQMTCNESRKITL